MYEKGKNIKKPKYNDQSTQEERQEKKGKTKHHSRRVKKKEEKRLKLKNGPFTTLKASSIPLPPDTPHQTVRHHPPYNYITMTPEVA